MENSVFREEENGVVPSIAGISGQASVSSFLYDVSSWVLVAPRRLDRVGGDEITRPASGVHVWARGHQCEPAGDTWRLRVEMSIHSDIFW